MQQMREKNKNHLPWKNQRHLHKRKAGVQRVPEEKYLKEKTF